MKIKIVCDLGEVATRRQQVIDVEEDLGFSESEWKEMDRTDQNFHARDFVENSGWIEVFVEEVEEEGVKS